MQLGELRSIMGVYYNMNSLMKFVEIYSPECPLAKLAKEMPNKEMDISKLDRPLSVKKVNDSNEQKKECSLTEEEKSYIQRETGWSYEIINNIESREQYEIYKEANLHESEVNGRKCLIKDIDFDYVDEKTGLTNKERMEKGLSPIDSKTGEKIELHHMGQSFDSPFAELSENSEHGGKNHSKLHDNNISSWRRDPELKNQYQNHDKPNHWKNRANEGE